MISRPTESSRPRESAPPREKYRLLARLDRGGMADVYLALSRGPLEFKKLVVVKCLRAVAGHEDICRSMFIDEARLSAMLNHPNVVQTYEISEAEGRPLIAMEYLEGQSLARLRKVAKTIDPRRSARIICDALAGLHHAHELRDFEGARLNVVHRDLSPQNIFVTYDGAVKILDFGVARAATPSRSKTKIGVLKGKFSYMAPEQTTGAELDRRTDLFAIGIVLWELLALRRMFGGTAVQKLRALIQDPIPRLSSVRPDIDPELERIVHHALEKDPAARYPTAQAMHDDLEHYLAKSGAAVRSDDIARLMLSHFAIERQELRHEIQELMAAESHSVSVPELRSTRRDVTPSLPEGPDSLSPMTRPDTVPPQSVQLPDQPTLFWARERRRALYVGLGLVLSLVAGAGILLGRAVPERTASESARVTAEAPQLSRQVSKEPEPAPAPAESAFPMALSKQHAPRASATPPPEVPPRPLRAPVLPRRVAAPRVARNAEPSPTPSATSSAEVTRVRIVQDKPRVAIVE